VSRHLLRPVSLVLGLSLVLGPGAYAEDPPAAAPPPEGSAAPRDTETINRIMQDNEAMLTGRGFTYDRQAGAIRSDPWWTP